MNQAGSSRKLQKALFPEGFPAEIMHLVAETWRTFTMHRSVRLEERITALLADALIDAYELLGWPWTIFSEGPITDPEFGTELGRNDLRFRHNSNSQRVFFTVECKRLHVRTASSTKHLADDYFEEGVMRFVSGKYGAGRPCGGMIAFVMDNDLTTAHQRLRDRSAAKRVALRLKPESSWKSPSILLPRTEHSAETRHVREDGEFLIHHLLLGVEM